MRKTHTWRKYYLRPTHVERERESARCNVHHIYDNLNNII